MAREHRSRPRDGVAGAVAGVPPELAEFPNLPIEENFEKL